jgi:hypothetical protein
LEEATEVVQQKDAKQVEMEAKLGCITWAPEAAEGHGRYSGRRIKRFKINRFR